MKYIRKFHHKYPIKCCAQYQVEVNVTQTFYMQLTRTAVEHPHILKIRHLSAHSLRELELV